MGGIGGPELLIIFLVVLLVFGPKRIPEVARGLGKGLREIRRLSTELQREVNLADPQSPPPPPRPRSSLAPPSDRPAVGDSEARTPPDDPIEPTAR